MDHLVDVKGGPSSDMPLVGAVYRNLCASGRVKGLHGGDQFDGGSTQTRC